VSASDAYRVLVTDDSAVIRGLITRILEADPEIKVVGSAADGQMAVNALKRFKASGTGIDVAVLDIEMPVMDGLTAIPKLLEIEPGLRIVMASTLTLQNASASLKALAAGAADYIAKPTTTTAINGTDSFKRELVEKVKALANSARKGRGDALPDPSKPATIILAGPKSPPTANGAGGTKPKSLFKGPVILRKAPQLPPSAVLIGSSTGGPQALAVLLNALPQNIRVPILVTQHMPPTFTTILAQHLTKSSGVPAAEAVDKDVVLPGRIYVAPGDFHMLPEQDGDAVRIRLNKEAPENFCRPSVDPMFRAASRVWGARTLAIVLTGMGQDGLAGGKVLTDVGGTLVAQDEATSVVWGMPGAVATAGLCSEVLPLPELASWMRRRLD
jgi:two-component system chemotaxis response regulator CheB